MQSLIRRARLVSGIVLMTFVLCHLGTLVWGLKSLEALDAWRATLLGPWKTVYGEALLLTAALVHAALGFVSIATRRSLVFTRTDVVQLILGLLTPPLLLNHVLMLRVTRHLVEGLSVNYAFVLSIYWKFIPLYALQQLLVVIIVWVHAAIGLYSWLVTKPIWNRVGYVVTPLLFAVPIAALLGFAKAGQDVVEWLEYDPNWQAEMAAKLAKLESVRPTINAIQYTIFAIYAVLLVAALTVLAVRIARSRLQPIDVLYDTGALVRGRRGLSVLETSVINDIPHARVCAGRGRCGTCLVTIVPAAGVSKTTLIERKTLRRLAAGPGVRLGCQAYLKGPPVAVTRLVAAYADAADARLAKELRAIPEPAE